MQLPSWSLGTLAFEKPATICKKSDHPETSRPHGGALEDEVPRGETAHAVIQGPWLLTPLDLPSSRGPCRSLLNPQHPADTMGMRRKDRGVWFRGSSPGSHSHHFCPPSPVIRTQSHGTLVARDPGKCSSLPRRNREWIWRTPRLQKGLWIAMLGEY